MIVAVLGAAPFAVTLLTMPFGRDQGIYAYTGARILAGDVPYRDIFSFKPPSTAILHAVALLVFGHSMTSIRALDLLWTLATAGTLAWIGARWWDSRLAGALSGVVFAAIYCHFNYWTTGQTDGWATLPVALALAFVPDRRLAPISGALLGVALVFKYTFVGFVPLVLAAWWWHDRKSAGYAALGLAGALAGSVLLLGLWGGLPAFLRTQVEVTLPYTGLDPRVAAPSGSGADAVWKNVRSIGDHWLALGAVGMAVAVADVARGRSRAERAWHLGWWAAAILSLVVQKKFFQYHFLPTLAPLAIAVGGVGAGLQRVADRWKWEVHPALAGVVLAALLASPFPRRFEYIEGQLQGKRSFEAYWRSRNFKTPDTYLSDNLDMAAWIRKNSGPDDRVFLWSYEPIVYFLADRRLVSRFLYHYPLVVPWAPPAYRDELMAAIEEDPPALFGVCDQDASPSVLGRPETSWHTFRAFTALSAWVDEHCAPAERVGRWHTFRCGR